MRAWVYKSGKKEQTYLYVPEQDRFDDVPEGLELLGELKLVLSVELSEQRKLAQVEASEVMDRIRENGYFLQMPPPKNGVPNPC